MQHITLYCAWDSFLSPNLCLGFTNNSTVENAEILGFIYIKDPWPMITLKHLETQGSSFLAGREKCALRSSQRRPRDKIGGAYFGGKATAKLPSQHVVTWRPLGQAQQPASRGEEATNLGSPEESAVR